MRGGAAKLRQQDHTRGQDVETTQLQNERADACAERAGFWRYLSRLFYRELDEELLERLRGQAVLPLSDDFDAEVRACAKPRHADAVALRLRSRVFGGRVDDR